jgi:D-glucuronyl C5-epimerase C-terminus
VRGRALIIASAIVAVLVVGAAPASSVTPLERAALRALATTRLDAETRAQGRAEVRRAAYLARILPSGRREHVAVALGELASFKGKLTQPRAVTLIGELKANDDYFLKHYAPAPKTDIADADGVVYRYFAGRCFEYHPLANFGALNARVAAGDAEGAQLLADALVARGTYLHGGGIGWEYLFPFSGGRGPWLSGMAQAVAAQALARTASLVPEDAAMLLGKARAAYQAIPNRLVTSVAAGPWIRLYSFTSLQVLNAQLQAVISLQSYATTANDTEAAALAARMQRATLATLPRFDTGYWSYYALPHEPSPFDYHDYVVQLLKRLAPADQRFGEAAARFARYEKEPPAFTLANGGLGSLAFWLSKPATVSVVTAAGPSKRVSMVGGWHTLTWKEPKKPGVYATRVSAVDYGGNRTSFETLPFVRAAATVRKTQAAPAPSPSLRVGAALDDPALSAQAVDQGVTLQRLGVVWPAGATAPDGAAVEALQQLAPGASVIVELAATPLPADDAARAALAQYAAALAASVPQLDALVLAAGGPADLYAAALSAIRAALPSSPLGVAIDGNSSPDAVVASLAGAAVEAVAFRPAAAPGAGLWTLAELGRVRDAFPDAKLVVDGLPAPYASNLRALACGNAAADVVLDQLGDAFRTTVRSAAEIAERGTYVCPGLAASVAPATAIGWPTSLAAGPVAVALDCSRDCLYLVTLVDSAGRPVVARRGQLTGGPSGKRQTVTLPKANLVAGRAYTLDVRLVARVNPGAVARFESPPLTR